jgi:hypothetical protein
MCSTTMGMREAGSSCTAWLKREWPSEEDHCQKELQYDTTIAAKSGVSIKK